MRIENVPLYIAEDGKEFHLEEDCVRYENELYGNAKIAFKNIKHNFVWLQDYWGGCSDMDCVLLLKIETIDEANKVIEWTKRHQGKIPENKRQDFDLSIVGHTLIFDVEIDWNADSEVSLSDMVDVYVYLGTEEQVIGHFAKIMSDEIEKCAIEKGDEK